MSRMIALILALAAASAPLAAAARVRHSSHGAPRAERAAVPPTAFVGHFEPDWRVQYGVVSNPRGASGSFGAVLDGRNPAAGAIP